MSPHHTDNPNSSTFPRTTPAITTDQVIEFLARGFQDPDLHPTCHLVWVVANKGMRRAELERLRIGSIDPARSRVEISAHTSNKLARYIPIRSKTFESLMILHTLNGASDFILGNSPKSRINRAVSLLQSNAFGRNQARITLHSLRRNFASRLRQSGVSLPLVKYCLGQAKRPCFLNYFNICSEDVFDSLELATD